VGGVVFDADHVFEKPVIENEKRTFVFHFSLRLPQKDLPVWVKLRNIHLKKKGNVICLQ